MPGRNILAGWGSHGLDGFVAPAKLKVSLASKVLLLEVGISNVAAMVSN